MVLMSRSISGEGLVIYSLLVWMGMPVEAPAQAPPRLLPQVAYQRLDSLERVALTAPTFDERLHATSTIAGVAIGPGCEGDLGLPPSEIRYPGIVKRLAGVYRQSHDLKLRHAILDRMPMLAECAEVAAFLAEAAAEVPPPSPPLSPNMANWTDDLRGSLQSHAIGELLILGARGQATLRQLYAQGNVRESTAREGLEKLAREGFRRPALR
jgi:hypothetical protein